MKGQELQWQVRTESRDIGREWGFAVWARALQGALASNHGHVAAVRIADEAVREFNERVKDGRL